MKRTAALALAAAVLLLSHAADGTVVGSNGKIAVATTSGSIYIVDQKGGSVATPMGAGAAPAWSPDGRRLVVFRRTPGACAPLQLRARCHRRCNEAPNHDLRGHYVRSGARLVFAGRPPHRVRQPHARKAGDDEIWVVDDGSNARQLTTTNDNFAPAWSPDGSRIAFHAFEAGGIHLYSIGSRGSDLRQLTFGAGTDIRPSWAPDGSRIAFMSARAGDRSSCMSSTATEANFDRSPWAAGLSRVQQHALPVLQSILVA